MQHPSPSLPPSLQLNVMQHDDCGLLLPFITGVEKAHRAEGIKSCVGLKGDFATQAGSGVCADRMRSGPTLSANLLAGTLLSVDSIRLHFIPFDSWMIQLGYRSIRVSTVGPSKLLGRWQILICAVC